MATLIHIARGAAVVIAVLIAFNAALAVVEVVRACAALIRARADSITPWRQR